MSRVVYVVSRQVQYVVITLDSCGSALHSPQGLAEVGSPDAVLQGLAPSPPAVLEADGSPLEPLEDVPVEPSEALFPEALFPDGGSAQTGMLAGSAGPLLTAGEMPHSFRTVRAKLNAFSWLKHIGGRSDPAPQPATRRASKKKTPVAAPASPVVEPMGPDTQPPAQSARGCLCPRLPFRGGPEGARGRPGVALPSPSPP